MTDARPYRGSESYGAEHAHLFFGRATDTIALTRLVLGQRLSVLHAPSGAGKTSLLGAGLLRQIEDAGPLALRTRPGNQPQLELAEELIRRLLPPPSLEVEAIEAVIQSLPKSSNALDLSLGQAKRHLEELPKSSGLYERLLAPFPREATAFAGPSRSSETTPFFVRALLIDQGPWLLARYLTFLNGLCHQPRWPVCRATEFVNTVVRLPLGELRDFFTLPAVERAYREVGELLREGQPSVVPFFQRVFRFWRNHFEDFSLILVFDQFEEMFTRFVDQRHRGHATDPTLPRYEMRTEFFVLLGELLRAELVSPTLGDKDNRLLPIRVLVSMRDDYIARLDELEAHTGIISPIARYHLRSLRVEDADAVIRRPAQLFGFDYEQAVFDDIVAKLPSEGFIEPGHVQIICERLWLDKGQELALGNSFDQLRCIEYRDYANDLGGVAGILGSHFQRFLAGYESEIDRFEILQILEPLITTGRRRNIVEYHLLSAAPLRRATLRDALIEGLRSQRIVRIEWRLGSRFVELTHEFLIGPVLAEAAEFMSAARWKDLAAALEALSAMEHQGFSAVEGRSLTPGQLEALDAFETRLDLERHPWIRVVQFRSAIIEDLRGTRLARYGQMLIDAAPALRSTRKGELEDRPERGQYLESWEIEEVLARSDSEPDERFALFVFESALRSCSLEEADLIVRSVRRLPK
jgi:hypothetical protein